MEIKTQAFAGSMESNDVLIMVRQGNGLEIELDSPLKKQFGKQIIEVIEKTVKRLGVDNIYINVQKNQQLINYNALWKITFHVKHKKYFLK